MNQEEIEQELKKEIEKKMKNICATKKCGYVKYFYDNEDKCDLARKKGYQQAKSEASLGKFAVKLVEQGKEIGKSEAIKEFEKILKIDFDEQWIQYYKLDGGKIGVDEKMKINLERVKQKLKNLK